MTVEVENQKKEFHFELYNHTDCIAVHSMKVVSIKLTQWMPPCSCRRATLGVAYCWYLLLWLCVVLVYISRWSKKRHNTEAAPNTQELDVTYEEVDTLQSQTIRLEDNVAYGPVKQSKEIELKENVAYGPVRRN